MLSLLELLGGSLLMLGLGTQPVAALCALTNFGVLAATQGAGLYAAGLSENAVHMLLSPLVQTWTLLTAASPTLAVAGAGGYSVDAQRPLREMAPHPLDAVAEVKPIKKPVKKRRK